MTLPRDFRPINLRHVDARYGRKVIREIVRAERARGHRESRSRYTWAGPAAETAIVNAYNRSKHHPDKARLAETLRYDLELCRAGQVLRCEVKIRISEKGWVHPGQFDWISVPLHQGREPIKADADVILFGWWSADSPRVLWLVGKLAGLAEFTEVSTFYGPGELMPRGGYVKGAGVYQIDVAELQPIPAGLFREVPNAFPA